MATTLQELIDDRARGLELLDDIIRSAREAGRDLTPEERADFDYVEAAVAQRDSEIEIARSSAEDAARGERLELRRSRTFDVPNVNTIGIPAPTATRSLDELLWATNDSVPAGTIDKTGQLRQHSSARNSVEQVVVRSANDDLVQAPRVGEFLPEHRSVVRSFQKTVAEMALFGMILDKSARTSAEGFEVARSHKLFKGHYAEVLRALDVDTSGEGGTWVPTGIGAMLHEKVRAAGKVAPLFSRIDLPTNPWKFPLEGADATAYRVAEPTGDTESKFTASTPGTGAATFDAEIFGSRTLFSKSLDADSALAILPYLSGKLVQAFVDAEEKAILDGDTDGTHQDSDVGASTTDARTAWDGLRKKGLADTVATATSISAANLGTVRKAMGKWGVNPADLAFIIGVSNLHTLLADTNVLTVDKMGPNATILNGQIGSVFGVPVIVSEHVRENLNASGVYDAITTTKTYMLCVNRNEFVMGQRTALDVEVDDSIYRETYQRVLVGFQREDFQCVGGSGDENCAIAYNVTP